MRGHDQYVGLDCKQCSYHSNVPPGALLLSHPGVQGFCYDHGVDLRERRLWDLPFVVDPGAATVRNEGPWELAVTVRAGDAERVAVIDGSGVAAFD